MASGAINDAEVGPIHAIPVDLVIGAAVIVPLRSCGSQNTTRDTAYSNTGANIACLPVTGYGTKSAT